MVLPQHLREHLIRVISPILKAHLSSIIKGDEVIAPLSVPIVVLNLLVGWGQQQLRACVSRGFGKLHPRELVLGRQFQRYEHLLGEEPAIIVLHILVPTSQESPYLPVPSL